jgi:competence protein ComEA
MFTSRHRALALGLIVAFFGLALASGYGQTPASKAKVNINTASVSELETLPRIGPKVAQRIVDFRTKNGNFKRVEEIMKVQGIGEKVFETIKDLITVGGEGASR